MKSIVDTAKEDGSFSIFLKVVKKIGLQKALKKGEYTVFAPNDEAFSKIPNAELSMLQEKGNENKLAQIIKYHMIQGKMKFNDLKSSSSIKTLQGFDLNLDNISLIDSDIECSN
ncbi:MAG: fasciclin domain-containing protein, partial [archaeon]|nr:fasciclin domain-containing protein [archaeon]